MNVRWIAMVAVVSAVGCGGNEGPPARTVNQGVLVDRAASSGCMAPDVAGWGDPRAALAGATGDVCSFEGGAQDNGKLAVCINAHLLIEERTSAASQSMCGTGAPPSMTAQGCVESCMSSGGEVVSCLALPADPPSRQLDTPWPLDAATDCDALMAGCPEVGDPCTGATVCAAFWHPNQPSGSTSFSGFDTAMWCDQGALKIVVTD